MPPPSKKKRRKMMLKRAFNAPNSIRDYCASKWSKRAQLGYENRKLGLGKQPSPVRIIVKDGSSV